MSAYHPKVYNGGLYFNSIYELILSLSSVSAIRDMNWPVMSMLALINLIMLRMIRLQLVAQWQHVRCSPALRVP